MNREQTQEPNDEQIKQSVTALKAMNFTLADVQNGMGMTITGFLNSAVKWNPAQMGIGLAAGNIAQVLAQGPTGGLIDKLKPKRRLLVIGSLMILVVCI